MLELNDEIVVVAKLQARNDKFGNPRSAYLVNTYEGETVKIYEDTKEGMKQLKELLPDFVKPTFTIRVELRELKIHLDQGKYL